MSNSKKLRETRENTIINNESKKDEKILEDAVKNLINYLILKYNLNIIYDKKIFLNDIVNILKSQNPENNNIMCESKKSFIKPDGGFLSIETNDGEKHFILISEIKKQGTNNIRKTENKKKQAKGNAIERLGKNVIGLYNLFRKEKIFPFICFCSGCDFEKESTIRDRVITISNFNKLNSINLFDDNIGVKRGSFFVQPEKYKELDILNQIKIISEKSIEYYFEKYGKNNYKYLDNPI